MLFRSGKQYFREQETKLLKELCVNSKENIISLGGGTPIIEMNQKLIRELGFVIFLRIKPETVIKRLKNDKSRPLLQGENPEEKIKKGMYSKVLVETGKQNGYLVPKNAIVIKELYSYIFIVENGEARRIKIERGYSIGDKQEVISDELYSNMQLVTEGQFLLEDRDKVNILN